MSDDVPPIEDYAFLSDGAGAALVSRDGSLDWCCIPRIDAGACFARLLGGASAGAWSVRPVEDDAQVSRRYLGDALVVETRLVSRTGELRLVDCMTVADHPEGVAAEIVRLVEGVRGAMSVRFVLAPRFDFGVVRPWRRRQDERSWAFIGGDDGLLLTSTVGLRPSGDHDLEAEISVGSGERVGWSLRFVAPHQLDDVDARPPDSDDLWARVDETCEWWTRWTIDSAAPGPHAAAARRSAAVLKGLANRSTGAIAAAATTSLPESWGGSLNWDYRYSWIRDSVFSVRALRAVGHVEEADAFRRFIERSAAGSADQLQIMFGMGGERRLTEHELPSLSGYHGARPVRIGNAAAGQLQLDSYGELVELSWRWLEQGHTADADYWKFLCELVETAARRWCEPDRGLWEIRGEPRHFVHSKVMCWVALDRGIRIAERSGRPAPVERWRAAREEVREAIDERGYDSRRGVFVQAFDDEALDAALLLLPTVGFLPYDDERMLRTTDAIRQDLDADGLLLRYRAPRGADEPEGAFLACAFWLVECLARQGRHDDAQAVFERASATANDLGLFSEEYDTGRQRMLGNFPQALTHLSHIAAIVALEETAQRGSGERGSARAPAARA